MVVSRTGFPTPRSSVCTWQTVLPTLTPVLKTKTGIVVFRPQDRREVTACGPRVGLTSCRANPIVPFSGRAHYSIAADPPRNTMNQSYLSSYAPILIHLLAAGGCAGGLGRVTRMLVS